MSHHPQGASSAQTPVVVLPPAPPPGAPAVKSLTAAQMDEIRGEMVAQGVPVRFQRNGCTINIVTGEAQPKGINVIHQLVYWKFPRETSKKIASWLDVNAVFDGDQPCQ